MSNNEGRKLRLCTRCPNVATEQRGGSTTGKLCIACNKARRERQARSRMQPNCHCGSKVALGLETCRRCEREALDRADRQLNLDEYVVAMKTVKPHVTFGKKGISNLWAADGDGIISFGKSIPDAQARWYKRWHAMEAVGTPAPKVRQYYYQMTGCTAHKSTDEECICWHDEGTGPLGNAELNVAFGLNSTKLNWRDKL